MVVASILRSHVVFKFLNYVTDKIVRVVLTTLPLMIRCVQTMCVCEGETETRRERVGYVLSVHNTILFCGKMLPRSVNFILLFTVFFVWPVLWVLVIFLL